MVELFFSVVLVPSYTYKNVSLILTIHFWMRQKVNYHLHLPYALTLFVSLLASVLSSHSLHMSAASVIFSQFSLSASVCPAPRWRPLMLTPRWRRARPLARLWICPGPRTPVRTCSLCRPAADSFGSSTWIFNPIGWVLDGGSRGPEAGRWPWAVGSPWSAREAARKRFGVNGWYELSWLWYTATMSG